MNSRAPIPLTVPLAAILLILAGCGSVLAPQPDPSRFYVLTPVYGAAPSSASPAAKPLTIGLGPVRLPAYLNRYEIVTRTSGNRLELSKLDRWGEPLESNFNHVLAANLGALLGNARIIYYPWYSFNRPDYAVEVSVDRFESVADASTELVAQWSISDGATGKVLLDGNATVREAVQSAGVAASIAALSAGLGQLSRQIAAEIRHVAARATAQLSSSQP